MNYFTKHLYNYRRLFVDIPGILCHTGICTEIHGGSNTIVYDTTESWVLLLTVVG